ncbi:MAG: protein-tyrosine phosphatase family protein [Gemmatimonadaceae bacterium]
MRPPSEMSAGNDGSVVTRDITRPIPNSYIVTGTRLVGGQYPGTCPDFPGASPSAAAIEQLSSFLRAGITVFVDLTEKHDRYATLEPYDTLVKQLAADLGTEVDYVRLGTRDAEVCTVEHMREVLDTIDRFLDEGRAVYVHCYGGVGRTGMAIGCWLVRHGMSGEQALAEVASLFATMSPEKISRNEGHGSPENDAQRKLVRNWAEEDRRAK